MEYINKKTGAVIETNGTVSGGDWVPSNEYNPVENLTNAALMQILDENGVEYNKKAKKAELVELVEKLGGSETAEQRFERWCTVEDFATVDELQKLWRNLKPDEQERAKALLKTVSDSLRVEARKVGKYLDKLVEADSDYANVVKSVTVDVVARTLMTATDQEPMTQISESALGYSFSGSYLVPGGGLFIKDSELKRLGLKRQRFGVMEIYDTN